LKAPRFVKAPDPPETTECDKRAVGIGKKKSEGIGRCSKLRERGGKRKRGKRLTWEEGPPKGMQNRGAGTEGRKLSQVGAEKGIMWAVKRHVKPKKGQLKERDIRKRRKRRLN